MVIMGKNIGFCNGVKRTIDETIKLICNEKVYALGMLVHNENVMNNLKNKGLIVVDDIDDVPNNSNIIFRAHGVSKEIYEKAKSKKLKIYDLTCPNVLNIHKKVKELNNKGYNILLYGKKDHPEVIGIMSYCNGIVFENVEEIKKIKKRSALLSQTTMKYEKFENIKNELLKKKSDLLVYNTICKSTIKREEEVRKISKMSDHLLIVGSKMSSNTNKLLEVSLCKNNYLVDESFDKKLDGIIGIVTGTSTCIEDAIKIGEKYE